MIILGRFIIGALVVSTVLGVRIYKVKPGGIFELASTTSQSSISTSTTASEGVVPTSPSILTEVILNNARRKRSENNGLISERSGVNRYQDDLTRYNSSDYLTEESQGVTENDYSFRTVGGSTAAGGIYKVKLIQEWRGVPIYGSNVVMEKENGADLILESADGVFISGIEEDIPSAVPNITKEDAIRLAIEFNMDQGKTVENPSAKLVIDTIGDRAILAYLINYFVPGEDQLLPESESEPPIGTGDDHTSFLQNLINRGSGSKRPYVSMDAITGHVYRSWNGLPNALRPSRLQLFAGNPVYGEKIHTVYMYRDSDTDMCYYEIPIGSGYTLKVSSRKSSANPYKVRCDTISSPTYDRANGAASPTNSAYRWARASTRFLVRTSSKRWNFNLRIETQFTGIHAVWTGYSVQLGNGDPWYFYPLTTPDIVAHEVAHAFTEHNSHLEYKHQSGAISEAYSDMTAAAFLDDYLGCNETQVYLAGGTVVFKGYFKGIRNMCNPRDKDLLTYNPEKPIVVSALDYTPDVKVHNGSALYSKAFCLLSKTPGWSIQRAFKVFTNANVLYWTPRETFNSAACGVKKAARDYMDTQKALNDVDAAFAAVDIACDQDVKNYS